MADRKSRDAILAAVRKQHFVADDSADSLLEGQLTTFDDPQQSFAETLSSIGGDFRLCQGSPTSVLDDIAQYRDANVVFSAISEVPSRGCDPYAIDDPHELENVDFAVLPGEFGVAENGAVWVREPDRDFPRVIYFLAQHVALVVPAGAFVSNMHEAYARLGDAFSSPGFGCFIAGPSKTADIEQSLVIGAHGARSLTVIAK